ncbi:MAG: hypothetical protein IJ419_04720 [Agathobacter sp.]|nr:hypothetical protein [Agathobacter sp.]
MMNQIVKNEVFIRGMLVGKYKHDNKTTAVICSRAANKEHPNYQYVTFFDEQKEIVDNMQIHDRVVVTARAWIFRDQDTKQVNTDNLRLRGLSIELARDFSKRVFASVGVPIYGLQMLDCVRFTFNGSITSISETKNHKVSILLAVSEDNRNGFNLIPLLYAGRGEEDDIKNVLQKYKKGQVISVKGFVSQKSIEVPNENGGDPLHEYKNTYFITSFLSSEMQADFDDME